ncbi:tetratricopeptide repeat protein, partial [Cecembia sp.]
MNSKWLVVLFFLFTLVACDSEDDKKGRFLLKGNEKLKENDTKSAIDFYSEAIKIDPEFVDALYNRGLVYQRNNRLDDAIRDYGAVLTVMP